ncbi:guanine deaminase [Novosphingobium rosa]|uniref:guanine deaminase n=1 Tax=Novosphingobium rosa TaxID=76978 RepID=UPI0009FCA6ED|nr:guanine deaminase [Novosphingobium rosa]
MLKGFRAELLSLPHDPRVAGDQALRHEPDGLLVVEDGIVIARGDHATLAPRFPGLAIEDHRGRLLVPGFVDTHIHYPQTERIAAHGLQLLGWLEQHIFPAERAFADPAHASDVSAFFLDELLRHGTTSALVFATVHEGSVDALFAAAVERNMRIASGKVLMDLGPEGLRDTPETARSESEALIARWQGKGRLSYAVTPRFALTSSNAQLAVAGDLLTAHPETLLHTHISENRDEIAAVLGRFPDASDYLDVYDRFGLVGPRSIFAHGIHVSDRECCRLHDSGAGVALCPTSNLFLGSGLFDLARLDAHGVALGLGTDVGAGTSLSMLATMGEAYKVCQLQGHPLNPFRALYLATQGGANMLSMGSQVGALMEGQEADFLLLDHAATPLAARRCAHLPLAERLFAMQILGDDRFIARTYIAGNLAHDRDAPKAGPEAQRGH